MDELKGCPFCGSKPKMWQDMFERWSIACTECHASTHPSGCGRQRHQVILAWNRRENG